jgi:hypothetical protein
MYESILQRLRAAYASNGIPWDESLARLPLARLVLLTEAWETRAADGVVDECPFIKPDPDASAAAIGLDQPSRFVKRFVTRHGSGGNGNNAGRLHRYRRGCRDDGYPIS